MNGIELVAVEAGGERLEPLARELERVFRRPCSVRRGAMDAGFAFDAARRQYYSTAILQRLLGLAGGAGRLLGVTAVDLYVPVLTFVFGEAQVAGACALVSACRLREEFYGLPPREELFQERLVKEAVHELGHTFGLRHCDDWRCVMASSHAVERIDVKSAEFCAACRKVVDAG